MAHTFATVRDLLYWEYAKLIAGSATGDRRAFGFVTVTYRKLREGKLNPSAILTENKRLIFEGESCAYCGATGRLEWEHVIPLAVGGPDSIDNLVRACRPCNAAKGARDPYQWLLDQPGKEVPRLVLGKLLKLLFDAYEQRNLLDSPEYMKDNDIRRKTLSKVFVGDTGDAA
jgi:hypothetical protein